MKEIIAIIRPNKVRATKEALEKLGFPSITATSVLGRGKQRGIADEVNYTVSPEILSQNVSRRMEYIPKREFSLIVKSNDVALVVQVIIKINQTGQVGDGKIFICPIIDAVRVRTDEKGDDALS